MENPKKLLKEIKSYSWDSTATVSLYIVKRKLIQRAAHYEILEVNVDTPLQVKLRKITSSQILRAGVVKAYDFNTADQDNDLLAIKTTETDFHKIIEELTSNAAIPTVQKYEDLLDSWLYVARLDIKGYSPLFSARRISESWSTKKVSQWDISMIFQGNMLVDLNQKDIFRIDGKVDFFSFREELFIVDKKNFEAALNFRDGMEQNRDAIVQEFVQLNLFTNPQEIASLVGDNMRRLRKLSQVKKAGYYADPKYMAKLKSVNAKKGWGLQFTKTGQLIVDESNIEEILRLLNNDRLKSEINDEDFNVDVKHKISGVIP